MNLLSPPACDRGRLVSGCPAQGFGDPKLALLIIPVSQAEGYSQEQEIFG